MTIQQIVEWSIRETGRFDLVGMSGGVPNFASDNGVLKYVNAAAQRIYDDVQSLMGDGPVGLHLPYDCHAIYAPGMKIPKSLWLYDSLGYAHNPAFRPMDTLLLDNQQDWDDLVVAEPNVWTAVPTTSTTRTVLANTSLGSATVEAGATWVWGGGVWTHAADAVFGILSWTITDPTVLGYLQNSLTMYAVLGYTETSVPTKSKYWYTDISTGSQTFSGTSPSTSNTLTISAASSTSAKISLAVESDFVGTITSFVVTQSVPAWRLYILPPAEESYTVSLYGVLAPTEITAMTQETWLTMNRPRLLVKALNLELAEAFSSPDKKNRQDDYQIAIAGANNDGVERELEMLRDEEGKLEIEG